MKYVLENVKRIRQICNVSTAVVLADLNSLPESEVMQLCRASLRSCYNAPFLNPSKLHSIGDFKEPTQTTRVQNFVGTLDCKFLFKLIFL